MSEILNFKLTPGEIQLVGRGNCKGYDVNNDMGSIEPAPIVIGGESLHYFVSEDNSTTSNGYTKSTCVMLFYDDGHDDINFNELHVWNEDKTYDTVFLKGVSLPNTFANIQDNTSNTGVYTSFPEKYNNQPGLFDISNYNFYIQAQDPYDIKIKLGNYASVLWNNIDISGSFDPYSLWGKTKQYGDNDYTYIEFNANDEKIPYWIFSNELNSLQGTEYIQLGFTSEDGVILSFVLKCNSSIFENDSTYDVKILSGYLDSDARAGGITNISSGDVYQVKTRIKAINGTIEIKIPITEIFNNYDIESYINDYILNVDSTDPLIGLFTLENMDEESPILDITFKKVEPLPQTGPISMGLIRDYLGLEGTVSLNQTEFRELAGKTITPVFKLTNESNYPLSLVLLSKNKDEDFSTMKVGDTFYLSHTGSHSGGTQEYPVFVNNEQVDKFTAGELQLIAKEINDVFICNEDNVPSHSNDLSVDRQISLEDFYTSPEYIFENAADFNNRIASILEENNQDLSKYIFKFTNELEDESIVFPTTIIGTPKEIHANKCTSLSGAFKNCKQLKTITADLFKYCPKVEQFNECFYGCGITSIPLNLFSNCYNVSTYEGCFNFCSVLSELPETLFYTDYTSSTNFNNCFSNCITLKTIPSNFTFGGGGTFESCFLSCSNLTSIPENIFSGSKFTTSYKNCFASCSSLTQLPDYLFKDSPNVTSFSGCFFNCTKLKTVPEHLFYGCSMTLDVSQCFYNCKSLTSVPQNLLYPFIEVTNLSYCFAGSNLATIPEKFCESCISATNFSYCFSSCKISEIPSNLFYALQNAADFSYCFDSCYSLTAIPEGLFSDCISAWNFNYCFYYCRQIETVPSNLFDNTRVSKVNYCFRNCSAITSSLPEVWDKTKFPNVNAYSYYARGCTNAANYEQIPDAYK